MHINDVMATTNKKDRKLKPKRRSVTLLFDDRDDFLIDKFLEEFEASGYQYMTRSSIIRASLRMFDVQYFLKNAKPNDFL